MYCYWCGKEATLVQKTISYLPASKQAVSTCYAHCGRQWIIDDNGIITACGVKEAEKEKGQESADKEKPEA